MRAGVTALLIIASLGLSLSAHADMIEIKGRGVSNGKILSQDEKEVRFEDSAKNLFVVPKNDVLFLEVQTDAPAQEMKVKGGPWGGPDLRRWRYKAERVFEDVKGFVVAKSRKVIDFIKAPLDRSSADSRSKALADSMGELSTSVKGLNKQDRKRTANLKGLKEDQMHASVKTKSKNKKTGNFSSLD